jgi:uncharacterized protein YdaL
MSPIKLKGGRVSLKKFIIFFLFLSLLFPLKPAVAAESPGSLKKVLLIYEKRFYWNSKEDVVKAFDLLLHHFPVNTTIIKSREYQKGMAENFDAVIYIPMELTARVPQNLINDIHAFPTPFLWIGENFDQYLATYPDSGLTALGNSSEYNQIIYKNKTLNDQRKINTLILKRPKSHAQILAYQSNGKQQIPFALQLKNLWYIAKLDFRENNVIVTADLLHDFLGIPHHQVHRAFIRIEDVHPLRESTKLKEIADFLSEEKVPFMVALIPVYVNNKGQKITMAERTEFVEAVKYMIQKGGTVILHGYTHQTHQDETGIGFEFWDRERDKPLLTNNTLYVKNRLEWAMLECLSNGIIPLGFEPPHYGMSQEGYKVLRESFSTLVAGVQTSDKGFSTTTFPYLIGENPYMSSVIPENLSYINLQSKDPVYSLLQKAASITGVRDGAAGAFFHPYLDIKYLRQLVYGLKAQGYTFIDLKKGDHWVKTQYTQVSIKEGKLVYSFVKPALLPAIPTVNLAPATKGYVILTFISALASVLGLSLFLAQRRKKLGVIRVR